MRNKELVNNVLALLEAMGEIIDKPIVNRIIGLYKGEVLFGLIVESDLFLRTNVETYTFNIFQENIFFQRQGYIKVNKQLLVENKDDILQAATQAYWIASGKVQANKAGAVDNL